MSTTNNTTADTTAKDAGAGGLFEPVGWRCKTPHGWVIGKTQHASADEAVYSQAAIDTLRAQLEAAEAGNHRRDDSQPTWAELTNYWKGRAEAAEAEVAPTEMRRVAKRNLRSMIERGSDDRDLMLKCLEELS